MKNKSITFIVPTYNNEKYLYNCISSIYNQINKDDCIIIIDDCSVDKTILKINSFINKKNIFIIKNKKNSGVSFSRNCGINAINTDLVTFVDGDDTINDGYVKYIKEHFDDKIDCICFGFNYVNTQNMSVVKKKHSSYDNLNRLEKIIEMEKRGLFSSCCNKVYKSSIIIKNSIKFNEKSKIMEDYEFNLNYFNYVSNFFVSELCFYNYYYNGDISASSSYKPNLIERYYELKELRNKFYENYENKGEIDFLNINFMRICINNIYKKDSLLNNKQKICELKKIISSEDYKKWNKIKNNDILDYILKFAFLTNNTYIINFNMNLLHFIKNEFSFLKNLYRNIIKKN